MSTKWYINTPRKKKIAFWDGAEFRMPPDDPVEKDEILKRIAECKRPKCKIDGEVMYPEITPKGNIKFRCGLCPRKAYIHKKYRSLTVPELKEKIDGYKQGIAILKEMMEERA